MTCMECGTETGYGFDSFNDNFCSFECFQKFAFEVNCEWISIDDWIDEDEIQS